MAQAVSESCNEWLKLINHLNQSLKCYPKRKMDINAEIYSNESELNLIESGNLYHLIVFANWWCMLSTVWCICAFESSFLCCTFVFVYT